MVLIIPRKPIIYCHNELILCYCVDNNESTHIYSYEQVQYITIIGRDEKEADWKGTE